MCLGESLSTIDLLEEGNLAGEDFIVQSGELDKEINWDFQFDAVEMVSRRHPCAHERASLTSGKMSGEMGVIFYVFANP